METPFDQYAVQAQRIALRQALEAVAKLRDEPRASGAARGAQPRGDASEEHPAAA